MLEQISQFTALCSGWDGTLRKHQVVSTKRMWQIVYVLADSFNSTLMIFTGTAKTCRLWIMYVKACFTGTHLLVHCIRVNIPLMHGQGPFSVERFTMASYFRHNSTVPCKRGIRLFNNVVLRKWFIF